MSLLSAVFALGNAWVHVCTLYGGNVTHYVEASINEIFCRKTTLCILNIDPYNSEKLGLDELDLSLSKFMLISSEITLGLIELDIIEL